MTLQEYRSQLEAAATVHGRSADLRVQCAAEADSNSALIEHQRRVASFTVALPHPADTWCRKGEWHTPRMRVLRINRPDRPESHRPAAPEMPDWVYSAR